MLMFKFSERTKTFLYLRPATAATGLWSGTTKMTHYWLTCPRGFWALLIVIAQVILLTSSLFKLRTFFVPDMLSLYSVQVFRPAPDF